MSSMSVAIKITAHEAVLNVTEFSSNFFEHCLFTKRNKKINKHQINHTVYFFETP